MLLFCLPARAQWSGGVDFSGGYGWQPPRDEYDDGTLKRGQGNLGGRVKYSSPVFQWNADFKGAVQYRETAKSRFFVVGLNEDKPKTDLEVTENLGENNKVDFSHKSDFRWTPGKDRIYEAWLSASFVQDSGESGIFKLNGSWKRENLDSGTDSDKLGLYMERPLSRNAKAGAGFRFIQYLDNFKKRIRGEVSYEEEYKERESIWSKMEVTDKTDEESFYWHTYRITPQTDQWKLTANINYADSVLSRGPVKLVLNPGVRVLLDQALDRNSGATLVDPEKEVWKDSVRLRENFNFLSLRLEPYLAADFSWRQIKAHIDYTPQIYARRLTDDTHKQNLKFQTPYMVGNGNVSWQITPMHKLTLQNTMEVKHPDYIQICWYERQGNFLTQIFRGKESLRSIHTRTYKLTYDFAYKRFQSATTLSFARRNNEIDQTFTNEVIDGRTYQVFTWVNAANSISSSVGQKLGWRGKWLQANVEVTYKGTKRVANETGQVKRATDWRAKADAAVFLPKGWTLEADMNYHSDVATFFTLFKNYCTLNARVRKQFKKISVYLQAKDLLDNIQETEYISADQNESWLEQSRLNRRVIILGAQWNF